MVRPPLAEQLDLQPHPEGGWFRETWRSPVSFRPQAPVLVSFVVAPGFDFAELRLR